MVRQRYRSQRLILRVAEKLSGARWRAIGRWIESNDVKMATVRAGDFPYTRDADMILHQLAVLSDDMSYVYSFELEGDPELLVEFKLKFL